MKIKYQLLLLLSLLCLLNTTAQQKDFSEWDATAFCSYTKNHPFAYIKADNNWEIIQALRTPQTRQYLDSMAIKNSDSQIMLLQVEGLIIEEKKDRWTSLVPTFDSLQAVEARMYSAQIANDLYPKIKNNCSLLVALLAQQGYEKNAFSILFSYVLDGEIWKHFNTFEELNFGATWDGSCWAFYSPRELKLGSNGYGEFNLTWSNKAKFINKELNRKSFIKPFMEEWKKERKITSAAIHQQALSLGLIFDDGTLRIPTIDSKDGSSELNILTNKIIEPIAQYIKGSDAIPVFQEKFEIIAEQKKLACTILYHEVMWDLVDLLIHDKVIEYPSLWKEEKMELVNTVVYIKE